MRSKLQLASTVLFGLGLAMPATAQPTQPNPEAPILVISRRLPPSPDLLMRTVFIGDLNLASAVGQQEMEKRVGKAVEDMCAIPSPLPSYKGVMEKPCRDEAWASARPQMDAAMHKGPGH